MAQHAFDQLAIAVVGSVGEQMQEAGLLTGREEDLETLPGDLLGAVAEHALDRRALVDDRSA